MRVGAGHMSDEGTVVRGLGAMEQGYVAHMRLVAASRDQGCKGIFAHEPRDAFAARGERLRNINAHCLSYRVKSVSGNPEFLSKVAPASIPASATAAALSSRP